MTINQEIIETHYTTIINSKMKLNTYAVVLDNLVSSGLTLSKNELDELLLTLVLDLKDVGRDLEDSANTLGV